MDYRRRSLMQRVEVPKGDWRVAYGRQFRCDLLWPTASLCVEYDSDMFHTGSQKIARDARRRNALASLGFMDYHSHKEPGDKQFPDWLTRISECRRGLACDCAWSA